MSIVIGRWSTIIDFYPFLLHGFKGFKFPWEGVVDRKWHRFYECYGLSIKKNQKKSNRVRKYIWHFNYLLNNIIDIIKYICYSYIALFDITFIDMNNSIQRHHSGNSHEWLSAIFTFLVLSWVYFSMWNFSSSAISYGRDDSSSGKILSVNTPYWNDSLSYGFRSASGDTYIQTESTKDRDRVLIAKTGTEREVYEKDGVRVSFYPDTPIDQIDKTLDQNSPRAYSRLPNGIAVIEGNLDSPSAKTILATLHSR